MDTLSTTVDLSISCSNLQNKDILSKSDPACLVYMLLNKKWKKIGHTERVKDNLNPSFNTSIRVEYHFEEQQFLKFEVFDIDSANFNGNVSPHDDTLGSYQCQLAEICGTRGQMIQRSLSSKYKKKKSLIVIRADDRNSTVDETLVITFRGQNLKKMDLFGKSDPYFIMKRMPGNVVLYKSEILKKTLQPTWKSFNLHISKILGPSNPSGEFIFECYDWDKNSDDDLIGQVVMSVEGIKAATQRQSSYTITEVNKSKSRGLIFPSVQVNRNYKFYEYLTGGLEMSLINAIDFTGSNGNPRQVGTLHYCAQGIINPYEYVMRSIGEILMNYDSDKMIPSYGFGAKLPNGVVSHCFATNGNGKNPYCAGLMGLIQAYKMCITTVQLYGPTYFHQILDVSIKHAKQQEVCQDVQKYSILLIITDGVINDLEKTTERIVRASREALSIVIVGVGDANFKAMNFLDADNGKMLKDPKTGKKAIRDIVQFVPFTKIEAKGYQELAKITLAEIPRQVEDYFKWKRIVPNQRPQPILMQQQQQPQVMMQQQQVQQQPIQMGLPQQMQIPQNMMMQPQLQQQQMFNPQQQQMFNPQQQQQQNQQQMNPQQLMNMIMQQQQQNQ